MGVVLHNRLQTNSGLEHQILMVQCFTDGLNQTSFFSCTNEVFNIMESNGLQTGFVQIPNPKM